MKTILINSVILILMIIGNSEQVNAQSNQYLKSNVAISNIKLISNSKSKLHYELRLIDYAGTQALPKGFGLNGFTFTDDGKYNDRVPNDGIYTSKETISASKAPKVPSGDKIFYDEGSFAHKSAVKSGSNMKGIGCEFEPCGCPCEGFTCLACEWFGWSCWKVTKCEFIIEL